jgi:predicted NAD/FAD-binding protein
MLADLLRFNRATTALVDAGDVWSMSLGEYLEAEHYGDEFRDWYLLPMAAAIWSSPRSEILDFPLPAFLRFCHNHGLLQIFDRPQWRTVAGGARTYVEKIVAGLPDVRVATPVERIVRRHDRVIVHARGQGGEQFDEVVLACHSDQARRLLADPTEQEDRLLGSVRYQPNRVVLHTDAALLPRARRAWSAWNYLASADPGGARPVAVSYLINKLQPLPCTTPVIVTLNPPFEPAPQHVLREFEYAHPILDARAVAAQQGIAALQGAHHTWFAGAWLGFGFHEDGLASAHAVADGIARIAAARSAPERIAA